MSRRMRVLGIVAAFSAALFFPAAALAADTMNTGQSDLLPQDGPVHEVLAAARAPEAWAPTDKQGTETTTSTDEDTSQEPESSAAAQGLRLAVQGGTLILETADGTRTIEPGAGITTVAPGSGSITVVPDDGYVFSKAALNGEVMSLTPDEDGSVSLSVPDSTGSFVAVCSEESHTVFEIEGDGDVTLVEGDRKLPVTDGESVPVAENEEVTIEVAESPDSSFAGAELNGEILPAEQTTDGWRISVDGAPEGVVHVAFAPVMHVTSNLEDCTLYLREDGEWTELSSGSITIKTDEQPMFAVEPATGLEVGEVRVNGIEADLVRSSDGLYMFCPEDDQEDLIITALCVLSDESLSGVDDETGVRYLIPGRSEDPQSNIRLGSELCVSEVSEGEPYERAIEACRQYGDLVEAYDIALEEDGESYQPGASATVSFPVPEELEDTPDEDIAIIRIGEGGSLNRVPFARQQIDGKSYLVGTADRLSTFAVVRAPEMQRAEGAQAPMGDESNLMLYLVLGIIAVAVVVIAVIGLRRASRNKKQ